MTEPVICRKGKCSYKDDKLQEEWKADCPKCEIDEKIEKDLLRGAMGKPKERIPKRKF